MADGSPQTAASAPVRLAVTVQLGGLAADDIRVECVLDPSHDGADREPRVERFTPASGASHEPRFELQLDDLPNGMLHLRLRAYPWHEDLAHPFEMGLMAWL